MAGHKKKKSHENWRCVGTEIFQELNNASLSLFSLTDNNVSNTFRLNDGEDEKDIWEMPFLFQMLHFAFQECVQIGHNISFTKGNV